MSPLAIAAIAFALVGLVIAIVIGGGILLELARGRRGHELETHGRTRLP